MTHVSGLGSINLDFVLPVDRFPQLGETVLATGGYQGPGGKGMNQAIAAQRCGANARFYGRVGRDSAGQTLRREMQSAGLDVSYLEHDEVLPTGTAHIFVTEDSENAIEGGAAAAAQGAAALLLVIVNETEAEFFGGVAEIFCPAYHVTAVDTAGAGDTFCGALAAELSRGAHMSQALRIVSAAGAITATSHALVRRRWLVERAY